MKGLKYCKLEIFHLSFRFFYERQIITSKFNNAFCNVSFFLSFFQRENKRLRTKYNTIDNGGKVMKEDYEMRIDQYNTQIQDLEDKNQEQKEKLEKNAKSA